MITCPVNNNGLVMKQIAKTPEIIARLKRAIGSDQSVDNLAVYEAIALNSRPLRKRHPLYNGAVASRSMLLEMAVALEGESRPLQIMHHGELLPIGRVFFGEVVEKNGDTELRALFWVDKSETDHIAKIDNGTIDQVSVGVLPKQMICSADGFDFFGADSTFENIFTGTTPDGNTVGENGVYCRMVGLEEFFELSLVGMGGAQNAKIVNSDQSHFSPEHQRLAAGVSLNTLALTATATTDQDTMDLKEYMTQLTATVGENAKLEAKNETLTAQLETATTKVTSLEAQVAELSKDDKASQITELTAEKEAAETALAAASAALTDVAKRVLTASGKVDAEVPTETDKIVALINDESAGLTAALAGAGNAQDADGGQGGDKARPYMSAGFRSARR